jgi:predicted CXXCH cytochrome family protein
MRTILMTAALAAFSSTVMLAADEAAGKAVYDKSCKSCHGVDGTPNPGMVKMTKVDIKDFKTADFSDADIKTAVTAGKGKMKPVAGVTGPALDNVAAYVKSMKK